jgi:hypothetical protein
MLRRIGCALVVSASCLWFAAGCEGAEARCKRGRKAAQDAWQGYIQALEQAVERAQRQHDRAQQEIHGELHDKISPEAQAKADARYDRGSSAWTRAFEANLNEACDDDPRCAQLQAQSLDAQTLLRDFADRVPAAKRALEAIDGPLGVAQHKGLAVPAHADYPQLLRAQEATAEARELCQP